MFSLRRQVQRSPTNQMQVSPSFPLFIQIKNNLERALSPSGITGAVSKTTCFQVFLENGSMGMLRKTNQASGAIKKYWSMTHMNTFNIFMIWSIRSEDNSLETFRMDHQIFNSTYIFKSSPVSVRKEAALSCGLKKKKKGNGIWFSTSYLAEKKKICCCSAVSPSSFL